MIFYEQLLITLIDKFAIGLFILIAGYFANRALREFEDQQTLSREIELSQLKAALTQIEAQIKEPYGPLYGLNPAIRRDISAGKTQATITSANDNEGKIWRYFVETHFLPLKKQRAQLIISKIHLVEEDELPESWRGFLKHQTTFGILEGCRAGSTLEH